MKAACVIVLVYLALGSLTVSECQNVAADEDHGERSSLHDVLQRAESVIIRSILKQMEDESTIDSSSPLAERVDKRQHPGKREEDDYEDYTDLQKRQHPGKREEEADSFIELQTRQHPGKRLFLEQITEYPATQNSHLSELSKRQHPGKRYLAYSKRQHPGRREADEGDLSVADLLELDKRQHPGKRFWDAAGLDMSTSGPCDAVGSPSCNKASLLLELLGNVNKSRLEEKRQHPGKRLAVEEDLTEL
ncbi:pro-thyrotropin-releasing hormone [Brachyhypopomus gauderio]|uniref:pro-thyrotropin-releasing hormone n=1 Tax=Brachyhypopomus gauderio TaxID=698409 RepID=UPI004042381D